MFGSIFGPTEHEIRLLFAAIEVKVEDRCAGYMAPEEKWLVFSLKCTGEKLLEAMLEEKQ